jgi:hypothetical protein
MRVSLLLLALASPLACEGDPDARAEADAGADAGDPTDFCPDPEHPSVHYLSQDPAACTGVVLDCTIDQNGFQNACGCGCIDKGSPLCPAPDDPEITWISADPAECAPEPPACPPDETGFSNSCGCGCIRH